MNIAIDILFRVKGFGAELILKPDGTGIKARNISVGLLDEVRQHKAEIMDMLKANSDPPPAPKTYSRLELANQVLSALIPDEQQRRKIRTLSESDARHWRFLGSTNYQHILAGNIIDEIERITGKLICFRCNSDNNLLDGFFKELP